MAIHFIMLRGIFGCESRSLATPKMEFVAVIVDEWKPFDELYNNEL